VQRQRSRERETNLEQRREKIDIKRETCRVRGETRETKREEQQEHNESSTGIEQGKIEETSRGKKDQSEASK
jgi:hypothetical protein